MEIRKTAELHALYPEPQAGIMQDSPELVLMKRIAEKDFDGAAALFRERRQFSELPPPTDGLKGKRKSAPLRRALPSGLKLRR